MKNTHQQITTAREFSSPRNDDQKAAMFGLEGESLKKQSGELFLARLQRLTFRLVEGHQATRPLNSKGAMFGLDARIALAIFGALSIIAGAALYKVMQNLKVTSIINQLDELGKAYDAYYFDTGQELELSYLNFIKSKELITSTVDNWKGPYINLKSATNDYQFVYKTDRLSLSIGMDDAWDAGIVATRWEHANCVTGTIGGNCHIWPTIQLGTTNSDLKLAEQIDEKIDGTVNYSEGKVRIFQGGSTLKYYVLLKYRPTNKYQ